MSDLLQKIFRRHMVREREKVEIVASCDLPSQGLARLKALTEKLPPTPFAAIASGGVSHDFYTMRDVQGKREIVAFPLYFDGNIRIERAIMEKGSAIEAHYHADEMQHVVLIRGKMRVTIARHDKDEWTKEISSGDAVYFPPNSEHYVEALSNCYFINLNIPMALHHADL